VTSSWHLDSLGQVLELDEPDSVPQFNTYSNWGELLQTTRTVAGSLKRVVQTYDALGRLTHSEQQNAGVVDPETVHDYLYDQAVQVAPQVTPKNVLGRLSQATWPTGSVSFTTTAWPDNPRVFTNPTMAFVEKYAARRGSRNSSSCTCRTPPSMSSASSTATRRAERRNLVMLSLGADQCKDTRS
jgi:hypothetical protein